MPFDTWRSFFLLAVLAAMTPGPALLLAANHGSRYGAIGTIPTIMGNISGLAIMATASAIGIGGLLLASSDALFYLRLAGGGYLLYLGLRLFFRKPSPVPDLAPARFTRARYRYAQGLGVALSNPKAIFFLGALFPQFLDPELSIWPQLIILALTLMTLSFTALIMCAGTSKLVSNRIGGRISRAMDRVTGGIFILFGIALLAGRR